MVVCSPEPANSGAPAERVALSVILPVHNGAPFIGDSIDAVCDHLDACGLDYELLCVDDGSNDGTGEAVRGVLPRRPRARWLPSDRHHGKGWAVRTGVLAARGEVVMYLDADLSIPITVVGELLRRLADGHDAAVASRFLPESRTDDRTALRGWASVVYREVVRRLLTSTFSDTQCGGKAYRRAAARELFSRQRLDGFAFDAEVLYLAERRGLRVAEVPFVLVGCKRSTVRLWEHTLGMVLDLARVRLNDLLGRYA